jgi:hypothetical protein
MDNKDMPAMPISEEDTDRIDVGVKIYTGLTKREHFAGLAMQGLLSNNKSTGENLYLDMSEVSVFIADALLAELDKVK